MTDAELELTRTIRAPIEQVFARLADMEGHNQWMPKKGSMRRHTRQTSSGPAGLGTTYEDRTTVGLIPGEIVEFAPPRRILHHWWDSTKSGRIKMEGWPGYILESTGDNETLVRHNAKLRAHGIYSLAIPILKRLASRERAATLEALKKSFE